jgi:hypothetical protein
MCVRRTLMLGHPNAAAPDAAAEDLDHLRPELDTLDNRDLPRREELVIADVSAIG